MRAPWVPRFGPYLLLKKLAEGGMAELFVAQEADAEGAVVIKRMLRPLSDEPRFMAMFAAEAELGARLAHPNLVRVLNHGAADGRPYLVMEHLAGEDLSTIVRTASQRGAYVPIPLVVTVLAQAARGLHFAHELADDDGQPAGVVHRDVSPSNLFVTYAGAVKVLDFGIAQTRGRPGGSVGVSGKYHYASPEQARGGPEAGVDRRADVFSLGVALYEALTCTRPFHRDDDRAVIQAVLHGDFPRPRALRPELPEALERIVLTAMADDPERRHATAAGFADALETWLADEGGVPDEGALSAYLAQLFGEARIRERTLFGA